MLIDGLLTDGEGRLQVSEAATAETDRHIEGLLVASDGTLRITTALKTGTSAVQSLKITGAQGGTFTLTYRRQTTAPLPFGASAAEVQTALRSLSTIGKENVDVSLGSGVYTITFTDELAEMPVHRITADISDLEPKVIEEEEVVIEEETPEAELKEVTAGLTGEWHERGLLVDEEGRLKVELEAEAEEGDSHINGLRVGEKGRLKLTTGATAPTDYRVRGLLVDADGMLKV